MMDFQPNLFILGAAKCGTTTLYAHLNAMQDVCMSPAKEPTFFEADFEKGLDYYQQTYFRDYQGESVVGDARTRNLYLPWVPGRIHETNPDARLVVMVRDPVDRAFSHWLYRAKVGSDTDSFEDAIQDDLARIERGLPADDAAEIERWRSALPAVRAHGYGLYRTYLDSGYYMQQIDRFLALFPREQLHVIVLDDLQRDPEHVMGELLDFLGLDRERNPIGAARRENVGEALPPPWLRQALKANAYITRKLGIRNAMRRLGIGAALRSRLGSEPELRADTRAWLRDHYRDHVVALEAFLERDLSHWRAE